MKKDIKSLLPDEIEALLKELGEPKYRAVQIFRRLSAGVGTFDEMTDLSKALRQKLDGAFVITRPTRLNKQVSEPDGTVKYLWGLSDGHAVESVVMRHKHGNTVCISTQVGCRMGCKFCASTLGGLARNLAPSEMLDQVIFSGLDSGVPISNIVLMGIGEPLDNFEAVLRFLKLVNHPDGLHIGMRHISLSTCGLTEKVDKLGDYHLQLTLSVSLHAPDDETRSKLMPVNRDGGVAELLAACGRYRQKTGRRISFEYAMIDGVNDTPRHAERLAQILSGTDSHINLILLNRVEESDLQPSTAKNLRIFQDILVEKGLNVTIRRSLGGDIDASCGQLRRKAQQR